MTEHDLASLLRETPVPPSRLTTEHAIALGRKAVRRRRNAMAGGAALAVVAATAGGFSLTRPTDGPAPLTLPSAPAPASASAPVSPPASAASVDYTRWSATTLPVPDGERDVKVVAMDSSGRYVLGMTGDYRAVLWDGLTPRMIPSASRGRSWAVPVDVNASGTVIGNAMGEGSAWVHRDGVTTKLASPGGNYQVRDINDRGDILGWSDFAGTVVWNADSPGSPPRLVSNIDDPFALGEDGSIGGSVGDPKRPVVVGPDGKARHLAETPGKPGGLVFHLSGDFACGWVAAATPSGEMVARWRLSTGELTPYPQNQTNCTGLARNGALVTAGYPYGTAVFAPPDGTLIEMAGKAETGDPDLRAIDADATVIAGNLTAETNDGRVYTGTLWRRLTR